MSHFIRLSVVPVRRDGRYFGNGDVTTEAESKSECCFIASSKAAVQEFEKECL